MKTLRPAYTDLIPGRKKLSTTLLNSCYENFIKSERNKSGKESSILCDGWKNSSNNTKTVVTMLHNVYYVETYAVVSDNASAMVKMGNLNIHCMYTCNSHTGNLLAKDV